MILTTTIESRPITAYKGIVVGGAIMGANIVRDLFAVLSDAGSGR